MGSFSNPIRNQFEISLRNIGKNSASSPVTHLDLCLNQIVSDAGILFEK